MLSRRNRHVQGLTLIEVLIAMVIISIAMLAMLQVMTAAQTASSKSNYDVIALQAAQTQIDDAEANGYSNLSEGTTTSTVTGLPGSNQMTVTVEAPTFATSDDNIYEVDVKVAWSGGSGPSETGGNVEMTTLVSGQLGD